MKTLFKVGDWVTFLPRKDWRDQKGATEHNGGSGYYYATKNGNDEYTFEINKITNKDNHPVYWERFGGTPLEGFGVYQYALRRATRKEIYDAGGNVELAQSIKQY